MRFAMRVPMPWLRAFTLGPALLASFVLTVVVCALPPAGLGLVAFVAAGGVLAVLAMGRLEEPAIAALTGSRPASAAELQAMGPVLADLGGRGVEVQALFVRRAQRATTPVAEAIGGRAVVITPGLVEATYRGGVTYAEVSAVIVHAVGRREVIRPRLEVAVLASTTPWRMVVSLFRGVGRAFAWLPFMRLAWTLRGVMGVICVVQSVAEGRAAAGLLGGGVMALTYLVPACGRAIEARTELSADELVLTLGFGPALAGLLARFGHPMSLERRQRLATVPDAPSRPRLHLVRS
ncbi:hypothetical protein C7S10_19005 [Nocardioides currus]|uniref:Uncharacterized protein n=2 Tax=Nocardioides currus TaxID=2133958 RepID=A0A2R7YST8_9ACTN|nr:hypothetical protein C7S10_19005 [Nocardioides currus]